MTPPPIPGVATGPGRLHERRCARHSGREAAARCPGCGEFFCRECIVEHDGRLLCTACLARTTRAQARRQQRLAALGRAGATAGGVLVLWLMFYLVGAFLRKIPPEVHDGTLWEKAAHE